MKETTRLCPFETSGSGLPGPFFLAIRVSRTQASTCPADCPWVQPRMRRGPQRPGEALKARTTPEQLAAAYKALNIRDEAATVTTSLRHARLPSAIRSLRCVPLLNPIIHCERIFETQGNYPMGHCARYFCQDYLSAQRAERSLPATRIGRWQAHEKRSRQWSCTTIPGKEHTQARNELAASSM